MKPHFDIVTIIGAGLLGGSLGLALKARGLAGTVRGVGRRQSSLDAARKVGAIDEAYLNAPEAADGANLIVICTPASLVSRMLDEILPACSASAAVTDVASTKTLVCAHAERAWPRPLRFVGSHPMAGSEKFGPEHADAQLYQDSITIMTPPPDPAPDAYAAVRGLWEAVGSTVVELPPERHDALVARSSHIPHILAACIAELAGHTGHDIRPVVGNGFRDMTRVAAGRPEIWRDICLTNREAIAEGLKSVVRRLDQVRELIEQGDAAAVEEFFTSGRQARGKALGE